MADEIGVGLASGLTLRELGSIPWISVRTPGQKTLLPLAPDLGAGERETLALAVESPGSLVLLDDALARRHARLLNIRLPERWGCS